MSVTLPAPESCVPDEARPNQNLPSRRRNRQRVAHSWICFGLTSGVEACSVVHSSGNSDPPQAAYSLEEGRAIVNQEGRPSLSGSHRAGLNLRDFKL